MRPLENPFVSQSVVVTQMNGYVICEMSGFLFIVVRQTPYLIEPINSPREI